MLKTVWKFDCDPTAPKRGDVHKYVGNRSESPSEIMGMPVFDDGRIYLTAGGDLWWGKRQGWLKCIDAGGTGDVTKTAGVWSYPTDAGDVLHAGRVRRDGFRRPTAAA